MCKVIVPNSLFTFKGAIVTRQRSPRQAEMFYGNPEIPTSKCRSV